MPPRKKKTDTVEVVETLEVAKETNVEQNDTGELAVNAMEDTTPAPPIKTRAKREKRSTKHKVVALVTADGIQGTFQAETRKPLIAHLPIHSSEVKFHDQPFAYDPNPPAPLEAFNAADIDPFSTEAAYEVSQKDTSAQVFTWNESDDHEHKTTISVQQKAVAPLVTPVNTSSSSSRKEYGPSTLLVQFANTAHTHELPSETNLACFWCCETFSGKPCIIPTRVVDTIWHVYGNFCTPQCCMAYLLAELLDTHIRWERIALLHRLYGAQTNGRIYPAPGRESLQRFGGPISIEDFRSICESQRVRVDIHHPPMVSILASMDTKPIDFYETAIRSNYLPNYTVQKSADEPSASSLKLKRSKPLKERESTLDACLNITIMSK